MERAIRSAYQRLRRALIRKIAAYAVSTLVTLSTFVTLLLELRVCFWK